MLIICVLWILNLCLVQDSQIIIHLLYYFSDVGEQTQSDERMDVCTSENQLLRLEDSSDDTSVAAPAAYTNIQMDGNYDLLPEIL